MKSRHLAMLVLLLLPACASNDSGGLRLDIPPVHTEAGASRIVVVYERGPNGWKQSEGAAVPFMSPTQSVLPTPPIPGPPHETPSKKGCPIYSMPVFQPMPELPTMGPRGVSDEEDRKIDNMLMKHIGEVRQYTISIRRQMRQSYDDYIKNCNAEKEK